MRQELTVYSVSIGLALAVIMGAANVYLGLKVGMTVSASIPAAVVSMLLLRVMLGRGSVLEANQAQTAASAGESSGRRHYFYHAGPGPGRRLARV